MTGLDEGGSLPREANVYSIVPRVWVPEVVRLNLNTGYKQLLSHLEVSNCRIILGRENDVLGRCFWVAVHKTEPDFGLVVCVVAPRGEGYECSKWFLENLRTFPHSRISSHVIRAHEFLWRAMLLMSSRQYFQDLEEALKEIWWYPVRIVVSPS